MENTEKFPGINIPEQMPDLNSQNSIGSWRQLLSENVGRCVRIEVAVFISGPMKTFCGTIYSVGNSYVVLLCDGKVVVADILGIKAAYFE